MASKKELRCALAKIKECVENTKCENLHHKKAHQHKVGDLCPVEYELSRSMYLVEQELANHI